MVERRSEDLELELREWPEDEPATADSGGADAAALSQEVIAAATRASVEEAIASNDLQKIYGVMRGKQLVDTPLTPDEVAALEDARVIATAKVVDDAIASKDPARILGANRVAQLGVAELTDDQSTALAAVTAEVFGVESSGTIPGQGPGTQGGVGAGTGGGGQGSSPTAGAGTDSATTPGGEGARPDRSDVGAAETPVAPTTDVVTTGSGATTPADEPAWASAADALANPSTSESDGALGQGPRDIAQPSAPASSPPLNTEPSQPSAPAATSTQAGGTKDGPADTDGSGPAIPIMSKDGNSIDHFERTNADGSTTIMNADGVEVWTVSKSQSGHDESGDAGAEGNPNAGTTDDDGAQDDDSDDSEDTDASGSTGSATDDGTAVARHDPDAAFGAFDLQLGTANVSVRLGGAVVDSRETNTGNPDNSPNTVDTDPATIRDPDAPYIHTDPDAGDQGAISELGDAAFLQHVGTGFADIRNTNTGNPDSSPGGIEIDPEQLDDVDPYAHDGDGQWGDDGAMPLP